MSKIFISIQNELIAIDQIMFIYKDIISGAYCIMIEFKHQRAEHFYEYGDEMSRDAEYNMLLAKLNGMF